MATVAGGLLFPPLPFETFNETDVREEVITPLLRELGYRAGSENSIIREQTLRYPRQSLGLKNAKKDPELRGKADYILVVGGRLSWVIEAKAPDVTIDVEAVEQAWTYANHPEIRAIYHAICNGRTVSVFRTAEGPESSAVLSLTYEQFDGRLQEVKNLLSPEALSRDFPTVKVDVGPPIASGLRSVARITNGFVRYEQSSVNVPLLVQLQLSVSEGAVERDENGKLVAFLKTVVPFRSLQEFNERLGPAGFEMISHDSDLSTDPQRPTVFTHRNTIVLPQGEEVLNILTWEQVKLVTNVACDVDATAVGVYRDRQFSGKFESRMFYRELRFDLKLQGSFKIHLA